MLKKLDWYIIRKFLGTTFFILAVIMALAVIFDISERIDDFVEREAPMSAIITDYYFNFVFYYSNLFSGLIIFFAVIFFTSKLASDTEIVAILTGGISFIRLLYPYFIAATFLTVGSWYMNHYVLPHANKNRLAFEETYIRNKLNHTKMHSHITLNDSVRIYFERYSLANNMGNHFSLEKWDQNTLVYKVNANTFLWDTTKTKWTLRNYQERWFNGLEEKMETGFQKDTTLDIHPSEFKKRNSIVSTMGPTELNEFIESEREAGSNDIILYELEKHQRTSYPFSAYILTLIGVVIGSRKVRGGTGLHLATGVGLCLVYILLIKVMTVMATNAGMNPAFAVWVPNLVFMVLGYYLYTKAQK